MVLGRCPSFSVETCSMLYFNNESAPYVRDGLSLCFKVSTYFLAGRMVT